MLLENESVPDDTRVLLEAVALVDAGYEVTVVCPTGSRTRAYELVDGVHVYRYPKPFEFGGFLGYVYEYGYSLVMAYVYVGYILLRHGFDAIHVHTPPDVNALVAVTCKLLGKHFVFDHHDLSPELYQAQRAGHGNPWIHRILLWFERLACRQADRLISTNETQKHVQINRGGADPQRCLRGSQWSQ